VQSLLCRRLLSKIYFMNLQEKLPKGEPRRDLLVNTIEE
jgi:hypothetical protein